MLKMERLELPMRKYLKNSNNTRYTFLFEDWWLFRLIGAHSNFSAPTHRIGYSRNHQNPK